MACCCRPAWSEGQGFGWQRLCHTKQGILKVLRSIASTSALLRHSFRAPLATFCPRCLSQKASSSRSGTGAQLDASTLHSDTHPRSGIPLPDKRNSTFVWLTLYLRILPGKLHSASFPPFGDHFAEPGMKGEQGEESVPPQRSTVSSPHCANTAEACNPQGLPVPAEEVSQRAYQAELATASACWVDDRVDFLQWQQMLPH